MRCHRPSPSLASSCRGGGTAGAMPERRAVTIVLLGVGGREQEQWEQVRREEEQWKQMLMISYKGGSER